MVQRRRGRERCISSVSGTKIELEGGESEKREGDDCQCVAFLAFLLTVVNLPLSSLSKTD